MVWFRWRNMFTAMARLISEKSGLYPWLILLLSDLMRDVGGLTG
jgi:hypothetical protein